MSFLEFFGLGRRQAATVRLMHEALAGGIPASGAIRVGVQPHAPYSCGPEVYRAAAELGVPFATHLAESLEEVEFIVAGSGPIADFLDRVGAIDETVEPSGLHPVDHVAGTLAAVPCLLAHVNYVQERHLPKLAAWKASVVYCPRASEYFRHPAPGSLPHAYLRMLEAGVNVCLGTDSIVNLQTPDRISVLDEMRLLHGRDGTDPRTLIAMATVNGAGALGIDADLVTFAPGPVAGVIAVPCDRGAADPLRSALERTDAPTWISEHDPALCQLRH